jgi:hypothetical protein
MHSFSELVDMGTTFILNYMNDTYHKASEELNARGETILVKFIQMIRLQKAIFSIGMFSIFDAILQERLGCKDGFKEANAILSLEGKEELKNRFIDFQLAINALKHGRGRSYEELITRMKNLSFNIKNPEDAFFFEGDVSEISTLIEIDDEFVLQCASIINEVTDVIRKARPDFYD